VTKKNVLIITYWSFNEALIQTYTLPYVKLIKKELPPESKIFLFTLEKGVSNEETTAEKKRLEDDNIHVLSSDYHQFGLKAAAILSLAMARLWYLIVRENISYIHCWCTPGGAIGYLLSSLSGKRLILDSYEPHAEAMIECGIWSPGSFPFRALFLLERLQTKKAKSIISATSGMEEYMRLKYGQSKENFYVKPACVNFDSFNVSKAKNQELLKKLNLIDKVVCVYAGKFGGIYLDQEIFDLMKVAADHWGERFHFLLLTNESSQNIDSYCAKSGFPKKQLTTDFVPHKQIPHYMGLADFALTPVKPIPTKRYCTPIKNGEYWALGLPVITTKNISDDSEIILENNIGSTFEPNDFESYINAISKIDTLLKNDRDASLKLRITDTANKYRSFNIASRIYKEIYGEK